MSGSNQSTTDVFAKLRALQAGLRRITALAGANWALCAVFGFVAVTLVFDFGFWLLMWRSGGLKPAYRIAVSGLCSAGVLYVFWRYLLSPLSVRLGEEDLALRVEWHYPQLRDRLISMVQFARGSAAGPGRTDSRQMIDHVIATTGRETAALDFTAPLDWAANLKRASLGGLAVLVLLAPLATADGRDFMGVWFRRNVLFADDGYPGFQADYAKFEFAADVGEAGAGTYRKIDEGTLGVLAGVILDVEITARPKAGEDPADVDLPETVVINGETVARGEGGVYPYKFQGGGDFAFTVTGSTVQSGTVTREFRVRQESRPELEPAECRIRSEQPEYTGIRPTIYGLTARDIRVPSDGRLVLIGRATKPLRQVRVTLKPKAVEAGEEPKVRTEVVAVEGSRDFEVKLDPGEPGETTLSVGLTDSDGYPNDDVLREIDITVLKPDDKPRVLLAHPGTGDKITVGAMIRFELKAEDDRGFLGFNPLDKDNYDKDGRPLAAGDPRAWTGTYLQFRVRAFSGEGETTTLEGGGGRAAKVRIPRAHPSREDEFHQRLPFGLPDLDKALMTELPPAEDKSYPGGRVRWKWAPNFGITEKDRQLFAVGDKVDVWVVCRDTFRRRTAKELFRVAGWSAGTEIPAGRSAEDCRSEIVRFTVVEPGELLDVLVRKQRDQWRALKLVKEKQEDLALRLSSWVDVNLRRPQPKIDGETLKFLSEKAREQRELEKQALRIADTLAGVQAELECNRLLAKAKEPNQLRDKVVLPLASLAAGVYRVRELAAADPWLEPAERARLAEKVFPELEKDTAFGKGALLPDIAAALADLGSPQQAPKAAELIAKATEIRARQERAAALMKQIMNEMQAGINSSLEQLIRDFRERVIRAQEDVKRETARIERIEKERLFD